MMQQGGILALDLSGTVGFAYAVATETPICGVWKLPPLCDMGRVFAAHENELIDRLSMWKPRLCIMEAPLPPQGQTHALTMRLQVGLAAITECTCYRWETMCREQAASTVRKHVIGRAHWGGKGEIKPAIMAWCKERGFSDLPTHDAADALVLWHYAVSMNGKRKAA